MILKEFIDKEYKDFKRKAGHAAEKQMAFYLKRDFQEAKRVFVLNDVQINVGDDNAQIDHLIVYPAGFVLIESKSVSGEVTVNEYADWIRNTKGKKQGMPSPIIQAQNQAKVLKRFLEKEKENHFWRMPVSFHYDIFVAISDKGLINREYKGNLNELCKADQVSGKIKNLAATKLKTNGSKSIDFENSAEIAFFLSSFKKPRKVKKKVQEERPHFLIKTLRKEPLKTCMKCGSSKLKILYGRSYYFKCLSCEANTPLKSFMNCANAECKPRLRKSKKEFFKECESCKSSVLFFLNPE